MHAPSFITFHRIGLANKKGLLNIAGKDYPVDTLQGIKKMLNHTDHEIDILKIDIEGSEYLIDPIVYSDAKARLLLLEVHPQKPSIIHDLFLKLRNNAYAIYHKEPNIAYLMNNKRDVAVEYAFVRLSNQFWKPVS